MTYSCAANGTAVAPPTYVRVRGPFLMLLLSTWAAAQAPRLLDRIEAPIAYVSVGGSTRVGGSTETATTDAAREAEPTLQRLLADPGLDVFLGGTDGPTAAAWSFVRGVVVRRSGEFELALTGIVPGAGQPLMLMRVQLPAPEAERLQALLQQGTVATSHRTIGAQPTFRLLDRAPRTGSAPGNEAQSGEALGPGELIELAVVGADLVVGNDGLGMQELLTPLPVGTTAGPARRVLSADPQFLALRERLAAPAGSLFAYGDWQRLGHRLQHSLAGLPGTLLQWSGLGEARRIMLSLAPSKSAFEATLLLAFEDTPAANTTTVGEALAVDGWLSAAQRVTAKQLLPELPGAGLGGVVVAVDLASLAARSHRGEHMLRDLRHSFDEYGLDFDRNVLGRLGALGTVQLLLRDDVEGAAAAVAAVYAVRARSKKAAADLFTDLRRAAEAHGMGRLIAGKDRRVPDVLELRPERGDLAAAPICVAVVEDSVLVTFDADTIHRVHDDYRRTAKARGRRDAAVVGAIQRIGSEDISGLFDVDLQGLFGSLTGSSRAAGSTLDLSGLPSRHIGYLALEPAAGGSLVRVCVLSSQ
jgi:hypothetical protein